MKTSLEVPLARMAAETPTDYWNDSCCAQELSYAIERGAVGATTNPTIVVDVLKKEMTAWMPRIRNWITENPTWSEEQVAWALIEEMAVRGAGYLRPVFDRTGGRKGRLSIQTNPVNYRDSSALVQQSLHFDSLASNIQVKIPVTQAGIQAIEFATAAGVNINATVCFSVAQALAVAEAVERGLRTRAAAGGDIRGMTPVCTIMVGRLDDWIQVLTKRDGIIANPGCVHWAGIAVLKKAVHLFRERGYRTRLLAAAYRHHLHWTELIGGDIILTIPYNWQLQFNASDRNGSQARFDEPVPEEELDELYTYFPDFRRAYDEEGLTPAEFDQFGPTVRTLRAFISSYHDLAGLVRDFMLPNPDIRA